MAPCSLLLFLLSFSAHIAFLCAVTDPHDGDHFIFYSSFLYLVLLSLCFQSFAAAALQSLKDSWQNTPPSWGKSDDPCQAWEGVTCNSSRVTALGLSTMGLKGKLSGDIGGLTELRSLDLSFNRDLTGSLSPRLGDLEKLNILILAGCGFTGNIPDQLGNLSELSFLALNSNNFTGRIPPSLGKLSKLYWLDLADNQLVGTIPVSTPNSPGLDLLLKAKHFHFNKNKLSGTIPPTLFSSEMVLIHVLFDGNQFTGSIPSTLGLVQTLEVLRLDRNALSGDVPSNLNNLTNINELNLAHNNLTGPLPDLASMNTINYVDLSNNSFDPTEAPVWFSTLSSLTTLVIEHGSLQGPIPEKLFSFPQIQQVKLRNNAFNGTLNLGDSIGTQLQLVDLQNNQISSITLGSGYTNTLILIGNPVCTTAISNTNFCEIQQQNTKPYSTSLANCGSKSCPIDQKLSPQSCECAYPYEGTLYFRGPMFRELSNVNTFHSLEMSLWVKLGLTPGSVFLENPFFNVDDYLQMQLALFPSGGEYFNRSEVLRIGFDLSNQTYKPPPEFGPYYFIASPYTFPASHGTSVSTGVIIAVATGAGVLVLGLLGVGIYAIRQKKRAEKAIGLSKPFASWAPSGKDSGGAPQLKGARWFSYDELKKCTNNFSESNELGYGGYGKVKNIQILPEEFHELLFATARITFMSCPLQENKCWFMNLWPTEHFEKAYPVSLTYAEGVTWRSGIHLDWKRRLRIALGSARAKQPIEKGKYVVREVRTIMDKKDDEHYGLTELMDRSIRSSGNLLGFGKYLELALQCVEDSAADRPTMSEVVKAIETILQNDGMNTNSTTSASSSATDFGASKGSLRHPYADALPKKDVNANESDAFDYSGGYTISARVEPK
ncbi:hypothetical protein V6N11_018057 [Hibiscus sabdariffa]|uniref:non-specific serine/threonine protein kinase n=1 Tax=Hibiscus sabdariffa TaxID=183260 RepID=A0ABR2T690_9ROSI